MVTSKSRKTHLDLLRVIAILFVMYMHTGENAYYLYAFPCPIYLKILYIATTAMVSVAVPIFFMISGALLIDKEESIKDVMLKRVLRIVIIIIIFSVIEYIYHIKVYGFPVDLQFFLQNTIGGSMIPSYWYLYAYLAYLLGLPLLRKLARNMSNRDYIYLFILYLIIEGVFTAVIFFLNISELNGFFVVPFINRVIIFPLAGYFLENRLPKEKYNAKGLAIALISMIVVLAFIVIMTMIRDLPFEQFTVYDKGMYITGFTFVLDIGLYYIIKLMFVGRTPGKVFTKFMAILSSTVFGVYLIDNIVRDQMMPLFTAIEPYVGKYLGSWLYILSSFLVGAVIIFIVKLIPGVKKLL